jgi:hypothetical protein
VQLVLTQLKDSPCGMDKRSLTKRDICTKFVLPAPSYRAASGELPPFGYGRDVTHSHAEIIWAEITTVGIRTRGNLRTISGGGRRGHSFIRLKYETSNVLLDLHRVELADAPPPIPDFCQIGSGEPVTTCQRGARAIPLLSGTDRAGWRWNWFSCAAFLTKASVCSAIFRKRHPFANDLSARLVFFHAQGFSLRDRLFIRSKARSTHIPSSAKVIWPASSQK